MRGKTLLVLFFVFSLVGIPAAFAGEYISTKEGPSGYLAVPDSFDLQSDPIPAVLLIHDWWGLTPAMRDIADRLAVMGFLTFAVDLYYGQSAADTIAAQQLMRSMNKTLTLRDLKYAIRFLNEYSPSTHVKVAVVGWEMGADWASELAYEDPQYVDALGLIYGGVIADRSLLRKMKAPILGIYAQNDASLPVADVQSFDFDLKQLNKRAEIKIYPNTTPDFMDPENPHYNIHTSHQVWESLHIFLKSNLA